MTLLEAARIVREAMRDKSYQAFPLGQEAAAYLRVKGKRLTPSSYRDYESCLDKLARDFFDLELADFEPPMGTERLEEFLHARWGSPEDQRGILLAWGGTLDGRRALEFVPSHFELEVVPPSEREFPANLAPDGDGGNRTRAPFPPLARAENPPYIERATA